jgi:integrase
MYRFRGVFLEPHMPRPPKQPSYRFHKARNCAVVTIDGINQYLGPFDSPASHEKYARLIAEWKARQSPLAKPAIGFANSRMDEITVNELILKYYEFAAGYYMKDGRPTKELASMKDAARPLRALYGRTLVRDFGPRSLKAVRQHLIDQKLSRGVVNHRINRIKRIFRWGVSEELVPATILHGLQSVTGLQFGRTEARETEPVRPVPDVWVDAVLPFVSPQIAAMIQLQRLCGMRPCEVVLMRASDFDMSGPIWIYEPNDHKNRWRGHRRLIPLGPQAQKIVREFFKLDTSAYLFSPVEAETWRNSIRRQGRKTKMTPSQAQRMPATSPKRPKRDRYNTDSFRRAIEYGVKKAKQAGVEIPHWFPLQLRHSRATEVRKRFGLEGAQVALGHAHAAVTEVYAEKNLELAIQIARETG